MWEARCDCGELTLARPADVKRGKHKSCGCYHLSGATRRKYDPVIASARKIWNCNYDDGDIDFDTFFSLSQEDCRYCGSKPATRFNRAEKNASQNQIENGWFIYNGLDRIDSCKPHTIDNVVPCCPQCNSSKMNLTFVEFISNVERRYLNMIQLRGLGAIGIRQLNLTIPIPQLDQKNTNSRKYHPTVATAAKVWSMYRDGGITLEEFYSISQCNCEYCGLSPARSYNLASSRLARYVSDYQKSYGTFVYNGLDRIDSGKKHTLDNVVPCCYDCNIAKLDWTLDEFIEHNERQYIHLFKRPLAA